MAVHKLHLDDLYDDDFELIAIHSRLEDYRLAYFLNKNLHILLGKSKNSIEIAANSKNSQDLFLDTEMETSIYLIPEFKKVDYFLKIENNHDTFDLDVLVK